MDPRIKAMTDAEFLTHVASIKAKRRVKIVGAIIAGIVGVQIWGALVQMVPAPEKKPSKPSPEWTASDVALFNRCVVDRTNANYWLSQRRGDWHPSGDIEEAKWH